MDWLPGVIVLRIGVLELEFKALKLPAPETEKLLVSVAAGNLG